MFYYIREAGVGKLEYEVICKLSRIKLMSILVFVYLSVIVVFGCLLLSCC